MKIFVGIDPGETTGLAALRILPNKNIQIAVDIISSMSMNVSCPYGYPGRRSVLPLCTRLLAFIEDNSPLQIFVAIEDINYQSRLVGKSTFLTAKDIGFIHAFIVRGYSTRVYLREYSVAQHLRLTAGSDVLMKGKKSERNQQLRLALEHIYGEDKLRKANCRNDHKRMALSVATAYAMQEGAISW